MAKPQTITYQVGVDILEFPIYVEHTTICETLPNHIKQRKRLTVVQKTIKQH